MYQNIATQVTNAGHEMYEFGYSYLYKTGLFARFPMICSG